jgi:hypothetical protein
MSRVRESMPLRPSCRSTGGGFTPGNALSFRLSLSTNVDSGGTPDEFSFAILDHTGTEIPTLASFFDVFVQIDIDSTNPVIHTFATDTSRTPEGGSGPINIAAPTATPVSSVPEPTMMLLTLSGLVALFGKARLSMRLERRRLEVSPPLSINSGAEARQIRS